MEAGLARDLRVEGGAEQVALPHRDHAAVVEGRERLRGRPDRLDDRRADERGVHRRPVEQGDVEVRLERVELVAEGVAPHGHVEAAEGLLVRQRVEDAVGQHDQPGARAVDRHPVRDPGAQRLPQPERAGELVHHRRLAAGDDQPGDPVELALAPHRHRLGAERREHREVLAEVALEGEDPDRAGRRHQPRSASRCGAGTSATLMPTIASPSPREAFAISSGSS